MGIEYMVKFTSGSSGKFDELLRKMPEFDCFREETMAYEFRSEKNDGIMPDAEARINNASVYICDYGGEGAKIVGKIVDGLCAICGNIQVEEL